MSLPQKVEVNMYKMNPELKRAWDEVLFWARRLSYKQADNYPEWREKYEAAKKRLEELKARRHEHEEA